MAKETRGIVFFIILIVPFILTNCGRYYSSEVGGYVRDSETGAGINGVRIRFYNSEPDSVDAGTFTVSTATMSSGGNNGYYSQKIIWQNMFGTFGDEGDTGEVWISAVHDDYAPAIVQRVGILSETTNVLEDIRLDRSTFEATEVRGRVINSSSEGINNVRVVMDLASTTDDAVDYVATTGTDDGQDGIFIFRNVRWRDETPDSPSTDTENAGIYIDDNDYNSTYTESNFYAITLTSDDDTELPSTMLVTREPRTEFAANIQGECYYRLVNPDSEYQYFGIGGVEVMLTYVDDYGTHRFYDTTSANGNYNFSIEWTEAIPDDEGTGIVMPEGEDVILVDISFSGSSFTGNIYSFTDFVNWQIKSWINPNTVPDSVDTDPNA